MSARDFGNPLGNPLALKRKDTGSSPVTPTELPLASAKISDVPLGEKWIYFDGRTISNNPSLKAAYGPNRASELHRISISLTEPGLNSFEFSPDGELFVAGGAGPNPIEVYKVNSGDFLRLPTAVSEQVAFSSIKFTPNGRFLILGSVTLPRLHIYRRDGETLTKLPINYEGLTSSARGAIDVSPDGKLLIMSTSSSPFLEYYSIEGETFTKIDNSTNLLPTSTSAVTDIAFSKDGKYLTITAGFGRSFLYSIIGNTFTLISGGESIQDRVNNAAAISPNSKVWVVASNQAPFVSVFLINGQTVTKVTSPISGVSLPTQSVGGVTFSPGGQFLVVKYTASPHGYLFQVTDEGMLIFLADTSRNFNGGGGATKFSQSGEYLAIARGAAPYVTVWGSGKNILLPNIPALQLKVAE